LSYFSQSKNERDIKVVKQNEARPQDAAPSASPGSDVVSTLGQGMLINGNIVCTGPVQVFGRVIGDIHAAKLTICEGGKVVGNVIAPETVIQGVFSGTVYANNVKLQSTAVVDGEIFNKLITIEQNAMFEGVARRLDQPVAPPSAAQLKGEESAPAPQATPQPAATSATPATATAPVSELRNRLSQLSELRV
jgi:cytoskeletal protein CcmA (bactofilin family)